MKFDKSQLLLYAVTDRSWSDETSFFTHIEIALKSGVTCLQLREKDLPLDKFLKEAKDVKKLCAKYDVPLIINDNLEVAIKSGADGLHVGQDDLQIEQLDDTIKDKLILGVSAHNINQAIDVQKNGADYIGVGAVFPTNTKSDAKDVPLDVLKKITGAVDIPSVAIGGINSLNINKLANTGISGVAVVSAIFAQPNIEAATKDLLIKSRGLFE